MLDPLFCGNATFDNGASAGAFPGVDPVTGHPSADQCFPRGNNCPDDCQVIPAGTITDGSAAAIIPGPNLVIDTNPLTASVAALDYSQGVLSSDPPPSVVTGDDILVAADGGDGISHTGLGLDDIQVIPGGQGAPGKPAVVNNGMPDHDARIFTTLPPVYSDDVCINPSGAALPPPYNTVCISGGMDLTGGEFFDWDNPSTNPDPDGDEEVDNLAAVDDGEYFAVKDTNLTADQMPSGRNPQSISVLIDPSNAGQLLGYVSDGIDIYLFVSTDGQTWALANPTPILTPGIPNPNNAVVLSGVDGICETTADANDFQVIPAGYGKPYAPAITIGKDLTFSSIPEGDDVIINSIITTGANGVLETQAQGDDR
ncbi:MAG: hypothetical protein Q9M27_00095, partial [Mariprofundaceae bacterium]|nr:hypothetical protein [Mariprofundaceae bacterium]